MLVNSKHHDLRLKWAIEQLSNNNGADDHSAKRSTLSKHDDSVFVDLDVNLTILMEVLSAMAWND